MRKICSLLTAVAMALVFTAAITATAGAQDRTNDKAKPIILVHGYYSLPPILTGLPSTLQWNTAKQRLRDQGFTGQILTAGYYSNDSGFDVDLRNWGNINDQSTFPVIAQALNRYVYQTFTSQGQTIDLVGHSQGGMIIRSAVLGGQIGAPGFSRIDVEDGVTIGTPHKGSPLAALCKPFLPQCGAFLPTSPEVKWMNTNTNPQGIYGTDWTNIAGLFDELVPRSSALGMSVDSNHKYVATSAFEHIAQVFNSEIWRHTGPALQLGSR
ncbi:MAG: hypothetical protein JHC87_00450 [Thermoleophilaceae bacterium]|nr:hypothetical protein [Thermoleophilaceae bacterium]